MLSDAGIPDNLTTRCKEHLHFPGRITFSRICPDYSIPTCIVIFKTTLNSRTFQDFSRSCSNLEHEGCTSNTSSHHACHPVSAVLRKPCDPPARMVLWPMPCLIHSQTVIASLSVLVTYRWLLQATHYIISSHSLPSK